ncbi:MAG: hypothetical protein GKR96_13285 [Gammaproteobacteria bacterium]|nr:hypothetical protein [Gammaproteobacteria bacterium]
MQTTDKMQRDSNFDPFEKEKRLRAESNSWDTSCPENAEEGDIPIIDLSDYFNHPNEDNLQQVAAQLQFACEQVGFFSIIGHSISPAQMEKMFDAVRTFHSLPLEKKRAILMDRPEWPVGGVGYLPVKNRKLPARDKGNLNEAFVIKCDHRLDMNDNQWPDEESFPSFKETVSGYANAMEQLGKKLMPIFAVALGMPTDYFKEAFESPMYRLRMTHYPCAGDTDPDEFGIAPHVDTTFCTLLAQDQPGLTIFSERRKKWIKAPLIENAFIVNSGELLRQWTNDRFISVKHFANNNTGNISRYSIPFFLNANTDFVMSCVPTCCSAENPSKYPPISYAQSQAVAQGE